VADYMAGAGPEANPSVALSFQEAVVSALSEARLASVSVVDEGLVGDDYWVVAVLTAPNAAVEIVALAEAVAEQVPEVSEVLWTADRMEAALRQLIGVAREETL